MQNTIGNRLISQTLIIPLETDFHFQSLVQNEPRSLTESCFRSHAEFPSNLVHPNVTSPQMEPIPRHRLKLGEVLCTTRACPRRTSLFEMTVTYITAQAAILKLRGFVLQKHKGVGTHHSATLLTWIAQVGRDRALLGSSRMTAYALSGEHAINNAHNAGPV